MWRGRPVVGEAGSMAAGHDSDVHDDHGSEGDAWVLPPLVVGLVIGVIIAVVVGLQAGASAFN